MQLVPCGSGGFTRHKMLLIFHSGNALRGVGLVFSGHFVVQDLKRMMTFFFDIVVNGRKADSREL